MLRQKIFQGSDTVADGFSAAAVALGFLREYVHSIVFNYSIALYSETSYSIVLDR